MPLNGGHAPPPEPQRSRDEMQRAHDVLGFVVTTEDLRKTLLADALSAYSVNAALDVLCWALRHDHNQNFAVNLRDLERAISGMGYVMHELPEMERSEVPAIELLGNELAEARREIARLQRIIGELKGEKQNATNTTTN